MGCRKLSYYQEEGLGKNYFFSGVSSEKRATELFFGVDYYPYGKILREWNPEAEKYVYNGFERDTEHGLDFYKRRYYDSDIARFNGVDMIADNFSALSPFQYASLNPVLKIDFDGLEGTPAINGGTSAVDATYVGSDDPKWIKNLDVTISQQPPIPTYWTGGYMRDASRDHLSPFERQMNQSLVAGMKVGSLMMGGSGVIRSGLTVARGIKALSTARSFAQVGSSFSNMGRSLVSYNNFSQGVASGLGNFAGQAIQHNGDIANFDFADIAFNATFKNPITSSALSTSFGLNYNGGQILGFNDSKGFRASAIEFTSGVAFGFLKNRVGNSFGSFGGSAAIGFQAQLGVSVTGGFIEQGTVNAVQSMFQDFLKSDQQ